MREVICAALMLAPLFGQSDLAIQSREVGHETRDDDLPAIAAAPDGAARL